MYINMLSSTNLFLLSLAFSSIKAIPLPQTNALDDCPENGAIICGTDAYSFFVCNWGKAVPMGKVAAGNICTNGKIVADTAAANDPPAQTPTVMPPSPMPTVVPTPPASENTDSTTFITTTVHTTIQSTSVVIVTLTGSEPTTTAPELELPTTTSSQTPQTTVVDVTTPAPTPTPPAPTPSAPADPSTGLSITPELLLQIAPSSGDCNGAAFPDECATAQQAAPFISEAFSTYKIETIGEAAAILSLMAFESADFKFNQNHFPEPGRPGQGTKAMLMPNFIVSYVQSFTSTDSIQPGLTESNIGSASDDVKNAVLKLAQVDSRTFASAAWYYQTKCSDAVKSGLKSGTTQAAWEAYIQGCVNTGLDGRLDGWNTAVKALSS
jgi:hypothetical protein